MTSYTRYMSGQVLSHLPVEWMVILGTLFLFIFPGFILLAGMAIRNERRQERREMLQFDSLVLSFLKYSLSAAAVDRRRPWPEVAIAVTLRAGRAQYLYHRKSVTDRLGAGRRLATYIHTYHYVRNPYFRYGGIRSEGARTRDAIRKFVFAQKWHIPIFLAPENTSD